MLCALKCHPVPQKTTTKAFTKNIFQKCSLLLRPQLAKKTQKLLHTHISVPHVVSCKLSRRETKTLRATNFTQKNAPIDITCVQLLITREICSCMSIKQKACNCRSRRRWCYITIEAVIAFLFATLVKHAEACILIFVSKSPQTLFTLGMSHLLLPHLIRFSYFSENVLSRGGWWYIQTVLKHQLCNKTNERLKTADEGMEWSSPVFLAAHRLLQLHHVEFQLQLRYLNHQAVVELRELGVSLP